MVKYNKVETPAPVMKPLSEWVSSGETGIYRANRGTYKDALIIRGTPTTKGSVIFIEKSDESILYGKDELGGAASCLYYFLGHAEIKVVDK